MQWGRFPLSQLDEARWLGAKASGFAYFSVQPAQSGTSAPTLAMCAMRSAFVMGVR